MFRNPYAVAAKRDSAVHLESHLAKVGFRARGTLYSSGPVTSTPNNSRAAWQTRRRGTRPSRRPRRRRTTPTTNRRRRRRRCSRRTRATPSSGAGATDANAAAPARTFAGSPSASPRPAASASISATSPVVSTQSTSGTPSASREIVSARLQFLVEARHHRRVVHRRGGQTQRRRDASFDDGTHDRLRRFHGADVTQRLGPVRLLRVAHPSGARRRQHRERRRRRRPGGRGRHHSMRSRGHHSMRRHSHSMRRRSSSRLIPRHELFAGFQQGEVSSRARVEHARRAGGFEESGESRRSVERVQTGGVRERDAGLRRDGDDDRARAVGRHGGATVGLELLRGLRLEEHRLRRRDAPAAREAIAQSHLDRAGAASGAVGRGREEERGGSVEGETRRRVCGEEPRRPGFGEG